LEKAGVAFLPLRIAIKDRLKRIFISKRCHVPIEQLTLTAAAAAAAAAASRASKLKAVGVGQDCTRYSRHLKMIVHRWIFKFLLLLF
jgi:hypothetical protein